MEKLKIILIVFSSFLLFLPQSFSAQTKRPLPSKHIQSWNADLLITGGTIVTMDSERRVITNGAIAVRNGKIALIGQSAAVSKNLRAKKVIDASGKVIIPGLINTHTHLPMVLFRGISDDLDLNEWLTKFIFLPSENVTEELSEKTKLGLAELIRGGTTTYCDMYYFEDAIADETLKREFEEFWDKPDRFSCSGCQNFLSRIDRSGKFCQKMAKQQSDYPGFCSPRTLYRFNRPSQTNPSSLGKK